MAFAPIGDRGRCHARHFCYLKNADEIFVFGHDISFLLTFFTV